MATDPTYIVCPTCGGDQFMQARRIYTLPFENQKQRNWASSENASAYIVCSHCQTNLKWNPETQSFDVVPHPPVS